MIINKIKLITENIRLRKQNTRLAVRTIILESNLRTIAEDPTSDKAKEIIARYKLKIARRKEQDLAEQN